ncbi:MAG: LUD domain-containing protein [Candidatus Limnocylindria bacterium]
MHEFNRPASRARVARTIAALRANQIDAELAPSPAAARARVLELIPDGAEVLCATSRTIEKLGLLEDLEQSGRYAAVRPAYLKLDRKADAAQIRRMRSAPEFVVGSVHAVTDSGQVVIASQTGSQLSAYVYGAGRVIWVVGTQKLVTDLDEAMRRIEEHALPLEEARSQLAYKIGSGINKVVVVNAEFRPGRTNLIFVPARIGF